MPTRRATLSNASSCSGRSMSYWPEATRKKEAGHNRLTNVRGIKKTRQLRIGKAKAHGPANGGHSAHFLSLPEPLGPKSVRKLRRESWLDCCLIHDFTTFTSLV